MNDEMIKELADDYWNAFNNGETVAYQAVLEELRKIKKELRRKGCDEPKGFSVLEGFIIDRINELKEQEHEQTESQIKEEAKA